MNRQITPRQARIVQALHTANQWSADASSSPLGVAMLSLGTTRTIHDEKHRAAAINEIQVNIETVLRWSRDGVDMGNGGDHAKEIARLADLWLLVKEAAIGQPWISDCDNLRINEALFRAGKL